MCGIAGFIRRDSGEPLERDRELVHAMCDRIRHRGPDDEGFFSAAGGTIGMRRLSIIDLVTGHQPMSNEDSTLWTVFNGEVYNYRELRDSLISHGHRFRTNSDTETILHLWEQEGVEGFARLRGMFAYALWDTSRRELILVRDRFGKKPLYYADRPEGLYFASELKCLVEAGIPLDLDQQALRLYFQFGYIPDPWCAYAGVRKLPPGGWLRYHDGTLTEGRYWKLQHPAATEAPSGMTEADAICRIREVFDESVKLRLISDVPLGAFLSGGIDSSSVVASMALQTGAPAKTFSIGFDHPEFNELDWARRVAKRYSTDHHEIVVRPNAVELTERLVEHFDEPFADSSAIPTFLVSELAAQHVKVALTGDGGDELFGGYKRLFEVQSQQWFDRIPRSLRRGLRKIAARLPYAAYGKNYLRLIGQESGVARYFDLSIASYYLRRSLLSPEWVLPDGPFWNDTFAGNIDHSGPDTLSKVMYFDATAQLSGDMLVKVDRMSMANSLEVRCPLLDHKLAELAMQIPYTWKMREGRGKDILIRALGDRLPPELLNRPKWGFGVPLRAWMRGPLREFLHDHLFSPDFLSRGFVSADRMRMVLEEHESGRRNNYGILWMMVVLSLWLRGQRTGSPAPYSTLRD